MAADDRSTAESKDFYRSTAAWLCGLVSLQSVSETLIKKNIITITHTYTHTTQIKWKENMHKQVKDNEITLSHISITKKDGNFTEISAKYKKPPLQQRDSERKKNPFRTFPSLHAAGSKSLVLQRCGFN